MHTWIIFEPGRALPDLKIQAEDFDHALAEARAVNPRYCGGYVADDE